MEAVAQAEVAQTNQPAELSIEDRLLNAMGEGEPQPEEVQEAEAETEVEVEAEAEESPEEPSELLEEIEVDGEVWQVPPKLKEGFLRQQDYTKKTQEVAAERQAVQEQRKSIEAERQAFQNQVQAQQQNFQLYAQVASIDSQIAQYTNIDWQQLIDNDPVEAVKLDRALRDLKENRNYLVQQAITKQQEAQQYQSQQYAQILEKGKAELAKAIPDWTPDKGKAISQFGMDTYGFSQEEMGSVLDARYVQVLHDAYQYRQLQQSKPEINKKVSVAPKIVKSQAPAQKKSGTEVLKNIIKTSKDQNTKNSAIQKLLEARL